MCEDCLQEYILESPFSQNHYVGQNNDNVNQYHHHHHLGLSVSVILLLIIVILILILIIILIIILIKKRSERRSPTLILATQGHEWGLASTPLGWWENMKSHLKQNCLVNFDGYFAIILQVNDENEIY